jgi:uncharacterized membrane-anchored protein
MTKPLACLALLAALAALPLHAQAPKRPEAATERPAEDSFADAAEAGGDPDAVSAEPRGFLESSSEGDASLSPEQKAYLSQLRALKWVNGPATVEVAGVSKLVVPEGFVYLDAANTDKFLEMNENLASGKEVMVAPESLDWSAYLSFEDEGYVKDDEQIDAAALLQTLKDGTEQSNAERRERGWPEMHVLDWAVKPAYNRGTQRLEWATLLESGESRSANFSTKILGRRGYTSVILAASPDALPEAEAALNDVLAGYSFNGGETYAEWKPGDKVAEYGLAALVVGGAAAIATKKGFWGVVAGFFAAAWKFLLAGAVAAAAWLRKFISKKE